jgi:hypothetical protein
VLEERRVGLDLAAEERPDHRTDVHQDAAAPNDEAEHLAFDFADLVAGSVPGRDDEHQYFRSCG